MSQKTTLLEVLATLAIVLVLGAPVLCAPLLVHELVRLVVREHLRALCVLGGLVLGLSLPFGLRRTAAVRWLDTLQHELAHLCFALLLGASPKSLQVSHRGGEVAYTMSAQWLLPRKFLITIAPYVWSPLLVVPVALAFLVPSLHGVGLALTALALGCGLALPLAQVHPRQTDLKRYGFWPAVAGARWLWSAQATGRVLLLLHGSLGWLPGGIASGWHALAAFTLPLLHAR